MLTDSEAGIHSSMGSSAGMHVEAGITEYNAGITDLLTLNQLYKVATSTGH